MDPLASLDAHPRALAVTNAATFGVVALILLAFLLLPTMLSPLAFALLLAVSAAWFGLDTALWHRRGIRSVTLGGDLLTVCSGPDGRQRRFERSSVASVRVIRRLGRRTAVVRIRGGHAFRIADIAFPRDAFGQFVSALLAWVEAK